MALVLAGEDVSRLKLSDLFFFLARDWQPLRLFLDSKKIKPEDFWRWLIGLNG